MDALRTVSPTGTYQLAIPDTAVEEIDGTIASYWIRGEDLLLQLSSYIRENGVQVSAAQRLLDRLKLDELRNVVSTRFESVECPDVAAATGIDEQGVQWAYFYAVWPWFTVFATISHPRADVTGPSWARHAIYSLQAVPETR